ncbi:unnamed protein product, partial [Amoebophrya sp. A25]
TGGQIRPSWLSNNDERPLMLGTTADSQRESLAPSGASRRSSSAMPPSAPSYTPLQTMILANRGAVSALRGQQLNFEAMSEPQQNANQQGTAQVGGGSSSSSSTSAGSFAGPQ